MSRIDEALKRVSAEKPGRPDAPERSADRATIDHFPRESRPAGVHPLPGAPVSVVSGTSAVAARTHVADAAAEPDRAEEALSKYTWEEPVTRPPLTPAPSAPFLRVPEPAVQREIADKLVIGSAANHLVIEQYRRLAATLHDTQVERGLKTVMVTSALPREGKTLTAVNLALTLAESYARRVLLIDADLRKPSIHTVLGVPNQRGLSEALSSDRSLPSLVNVSGNCSVLTAGQPGRAPLAGLTSDRMRELLDAVEAQFDWVILDTPPVGLLPDGQLLAHLTRAVIFVIGAGSSDYPIVERAIAELGRDCIIGTVLNRVDEAVVPEKAYYEAYQSS